MASAAADQAMFYFSGLVQEFLFFTAQDGNMPHFPAGFGFLFPIKVYKGIFYFQYFLQTLVLYGPAESIGPDDIDHDGREDSVGIAQGIVQHDPPKHIKLGTVMGFNGMMAAVMYPWSGFIHQHIIIIVNKKFNGKKSG